MGDIMPARTCIECGAPLAGRRTKFCSGRCADRADSKARIADGRLRKYRQDNAAKLAAAQLARRSPSTCLACGSEWLTHRPRKFCTPMCSTFGRLGHWPKSDLPATATTMDPIPCSWCGAIFDPANEQHVMCSMRCRYAAKAMRRRGRESTVGGTYTWAEVIGLHLLFDRRCAYCEETIDGQPDPDHVLALSRGGSNSLTNILPSCPQCNSDKRDLTLDEWQADRARRGLPARVTSWTSDDARYRHLTMASPTAPPRSRLAAERHAA